MDQPHTFDDVDALGTEELRQRLRSLQALLARAPVPIAIAHDPDCRFVSANRALASLFRLATDVNFSLTPPPGQRPPYRIQRHGRDLPSSELPMQYAIAHRTRVSNEIEIVLGDGSVLFVQNDVEPLFDGAGNVYGCVSVVVDVTDRKLAEIQLRDDHRRKDEFLATLSHELRNPLAPIRTALEIMKLARDDREITDKARATIERQLLHLVRLTDDLLDVSRITQNKVQLKRERLDLRAVLHSAIEAARPLVDAQGLSLTLDLPQTPLWAGADFTRLSQAFANLLHNAAKFTDRGGEIRVSASAEGSSATVAVADTGVGIPDEMLPRIFEMFMQLQPFRDRMLGGLGIGLTLAKRLVELHGGTIEAHSEGAGRGSTFVVRLPLETASETPVPTEDPEGSHASRHCRVLVADDNLDALEMMRMMLRLKGHDVRTAADGIEAVEVAERFAPHIAFVDIGMPRMDGYEAARRIRERFGSSVVLVALTGWGQDEDKTHASQAGFDHHLTKPPELETLDALIDECERRDRRN